MGQWISQLIDSTGYWGLAFLMFLENVFPPIPSELIMPLSGYLAHQGQLTLGGVIVAGTLGSVVGALPFYLIGRLIGEVRLNRLVERHGHWMAISPRDFTRAARMFKRYGTRVVLFGRLVPGVRSLISIPAGLYRMPVMTFLFYTALGAGLWSTLLALAGYWLGKDFSMISTYIDPVSKIVLLGLVTAWVVRIVHHYICKRS